MPRIKPQTPQASHQHPLSQTGYVLRPGERPVRLRLIAAVLLVVLALLSAASYTVVAQHIWAQDRDGLLINVAGRQRMLSQRIALLVQQLVQNTDLAGRAQARGDLQDALHDMAQAHAQLIDARSALYPPGTDPAAVKDLYFGLSGLDAKVRAFLAAGGRIAQPDTTLSAALPDVQLVESAAQGALLPALDAVVNIDAMNVSGRMAQLRAVARFSLLLTLLALILMGLGVLMPLARRQDRAMAALERERNFAAQLMHHMGQGLALSGPDHRLVYVNPAYAALLGRTSQDLIGRSPLDLVDPQDREHLLQDRMARAGGHISRRVNTYTRPDGRQVQALAVVTPYQQEDGQTGGIAVLTDLTEQQRAERQRRERDQLYRAMAASYPEGALLLFDHSLRFTLADGQGLRQVNLSVEMVEGRRAAEFCPAWVAASVEQGQRRALAGEACEQELTVGRRTYLLRTLPVQRAAEEHGTASQPAGDRTDAETAAGVFAGMAIVQDVTQRRRAEQAVARAAAYSAALLEVARLAQSDSTPEEVALHTARVIGGVAEVDWGGLAVIEHGELRVVTTWHAQHSALNAPLFLEMMASGLRRGQGLVWQRQGGGDAMYVNDYPAQPGALAALVQAGVRGAAFVPLTVLGERQYLLLAVRSGRCRAWSTEDRALFQSAAQTVRLSLERRYHVQELERAALVDVLTGLGNRRAFERDLSRELERTRRSGEGVGVLMLDLDGLKRVNDCEGHERGDALLVQFAAALSANLRAEDRVYRLGGDEYAAILVRARPASAPPLEARVRKAVEQTRLCGFASVDVSAGLAFAPGEALQEHELLRLADERMYAQKQEHRRAAQGGLGRVD